MIPTQWPGLSPSYQLPSSIYGMGGGAGGASALGDPDGLGSAWWDQDQASGNAVGVPGSGASATMWGMLQSILGMLGSLVSSLGGSAGGINGNGLFPGAGSGTGGLIPGNGSGYGPYGSYGSYGSYGGSGYGSSNGVWPGFANTGAGGNGAVCGPTCAPHRNDAFFSEATLSSTGDPHLAATGTELTPNGTQTVDDHYNSMVSHSDLIDAPSAGGYRVATTVTAPNANGITSNASATVFAGNGRDQITFNRDGSFSITDDGTPVGLRKGQSVTLDGGATVSENQNGSLVVGATNARGGSISTTLSSTGNGVDVTASAQNIALGGDLLTQGSTAAYDGKPRYTPGRDAGGNLVPGA